MSAVLEVRGRSRSPDGQPLSDARDDHRKRMGMRYTGSRRVGPLRLNFGTRGLSSVSVKLGP